MFRQAYRQHTMKPIDGYFLIQPEDLHWRPSNLMKIPNAGFLERTKSEILGARLWRLPPKSANTLHRHPTMEEFYFVAEGLGRMRISEETMTFPAGDPEWDERTSANPASLADSESMFRQLFERSADAIFLFDPGREVFVDCNQAAIEMMRATGKQQLLMLHPEHLSSEL